MVRKQKARCYECGPITGRAARKDEYFCSDRCAALYANSHLGSGGVSWCEIHREWFDEQCYECNPDEEDED